MTAVPAFAAPNHHAQVLCPDGIDCAQAADCDVCNVRLCAEHSDEFTSCATGPGLHHLDCAHGCGDCRAEPQWTGWD